MPDRSPLPTSITSKAARIYSVDADVPEPFASDFASINARLTNPPPGSVPAPAGTPIQLSPADEKEVELPITPARKAFFESLAASPDGSKPISVLNFISLNQGKMEAFMGYGAVFASDLGPKYGTEAKLMGMAANGGGPDGWELLAVVHYPSIRHFAEMVGSERYKEIDRQFKVGLIRDTGLLALTEI